MPSAPINLRPMTQGPKRANAGRFTAMTAERAKLRAQREALLGARETEAAEQAAWAEADARAMRRRGVQPNMKKKEGRRRGGAAPAASPRSAVAGDAGATGAPRVVDDDAYAPPPLTEHEAEEAHRRALLACTLEHHRARLKLHEIGADNLKASLVPESPAYSGAAWIDDEIKGISVIEREARFAKRSVDGNTSYRREMRLMDQQENRPFPNRFGPPATKR